MDDLELKRSPGTCCPDPTCDIKQDPMICESCGHICSECNRIIVTAGTPSITNCSYCGTEIQVRPYQLNHNKNCFCNDDCKFKFQKERTREYQSKFGGK